MSASTAAGTEAATIALRFGFGCFDMSRPPLRRRSSGFDGSQGWALVRIRLRAALDPGPQAADFTRRLPAWIELGDALPHADRILMIVARHDVDVRQDAQHREPVGCVADAVAARGRLVEHESEALLQA